MPMLFYLPMIVWLGMIGATQAELYPAEKKKTAK